MCIEPLCLLFSMYRTPGGPIPQKSPTPAPQSEIARLSEHQNQLPMRCIMKIRQSEDKSTEGPGGTKREVVKPKIPIGKVVCFLMGYLAVEAQAQIGEIKIEHRISNKNKKDIIGISNMSDAYLGQPDKKFQAVFSDFLRDKTCSLKGKILDAKIAEHIVKKMGGQVLNLSIYALP